MANYPLKKIQIGSNTYEINGADFVQFFISAEADYREATNADIDFVSVSINGTQLDPSEIWSKLNASADNNANVQCSWHANEYSPSGAEGANLYIINRYPYSAGSSQDYIFVSEVYEKNNTPYITKIIITADEFNSLSATAEVISLGGGGGGGGGSVTTYYLYSEWGSPATFATLSSASTCLLRDSNSNNVTISTLATAFAAGTVYIQDADGALTRAITLGYSSGSVSYFVMLMPNNSQSAKLRSANWLNNKYQMYDITL